MQYMGLATCATGIKQIINYVNVCVITVSVIGWGSWIIGTDPLFKINLVTTRAPCTAPYFQCTLVQSELYKLLLGTD